MNAREVIDEVIRRTVQQGWQCDVQTDDILEALAAAGFVVVACPPGSRVVVDRTAKPCPECQTSGWPFPFKCRACGGSGVVEATTTYGLEATSTDRDGVLCDELGRVLTDQTVPLFRAVALPEDGQ